MKVDANLLVHTDFADQFIPMCLLDIYKTHMEELEQYQKEYTEGKYYRANDIIDSHKLVVACKIILDYYGYHTEDKSQVKEKSRSKNASRKVCNKKGRPERKIRS